jgi:DMSO/TMAO reductase YedYZ heme-binding membrane subunit
MFGNLKISILVLTLSILLPLARAQVLDSDLDGISDQAEINTYKTDPNSSDTDKDGVLDFKEILEKTDPNNANSSSLAEIKKSTKLTVSRDDPLTWYLARISGIAAFILFTIVIVFGIAMSSKALIKFRKISPATAQETHQFIALTALLMVVLHFCSFFVDDVLRLTPFQALIPFQVQTGLKSTMGFELNFVIALGIFAFYIGVVLVFTSYYRGRIVNTKIWRTIHYLSFMFYMLILSHGFFTGSDSKEWWMRAIYLSSAGLVFIMILLRIFVKKLFYPKVPSK